MHGKVVDGRSYSHEVLEHYRFRTIQLYKEGKEVNEIAHFFGVHRGSASRWLTTYKRHGQKMLKRRKASGPSFKLNPQEMTLAIRILRENATKYGFETPLWTCQRIRDVILKKVGKKLHSTNVMRWLQRSGLTPQKPQRRALQRDEAAVQRWLHEEWPKIRAHARRWQAMLYFQDEAGVSLTSVLGRTWAPKGQTPVVRVTGYRGSFSVTSAVSPAGRLVFRIEKEKVNGYRHVEFLEQILEHHPRRKVIVVEDRLPAHRSQVVHDFVQKHKRRFALYFLPPYAPDLNPDEHVWGYLKAYQLKAHQARTTEELKSVVKRKMQSIQRRKALLHSFFIGTYVT